MALGRWRVAVLAAAAAAAVAVQVGEAVIKVKTDEITHTDDNHGNNTASIRFSTSGLVVFDHPITVNKGATFNGGVSFPAFDTLLQRFEDMRERVEQLEAEVLRLETRLNESIAQDCSVGQQWTGDRCYYYTSCNAFKVAEPTAASGSYMIDPDGLAGGMLPLNVYCEMETDGGGWTLVMALHKGEAASWHMEDFQDSGINAETLKTRGPAHITDFAPPSAVLAKSAIQNLGAQPSSRRQYLVWIGGGLYKLNMKSDANYDWFQGIYRSTYTQGFVSTIVKTSSNAMPQANPSWTATDNVMTGRPSDCPGNMCHYIPDDVDGSWRWAHRTNAAPGAGADNGNQHASKVFIR